MKLDSENQTLEAAQLIIHSMEKEAGIRKQMETFGFTPDRMQTGKALLAHAQSCRKEQSGQYDAQWSLAHQLNSDMDQLNRDFKEHAKVVRVALRKKPETVHSLRIDRLEPKGWPCVRQADYFYTRLLELKLKLENYGISQKEIQQSSAAVKALLTLKEERTRKKGLAENSTQLKKEAFRKLRHWVSEFRGVARIAFKQNPQLLETFGIMVIA